MFRLQSAVALVVWLSFFYSCTVANSQTADNPLKIQYYRPPKALENVLGTHWYIYLDGSIQADSGEKLETFVKENAVPPWSQIVLNSPGGNLLGGLQLGRVIRKYRFNTDVGIKSKPDHDDFNYSAGKCYSACTYAYLGGNFRYLTKSSKYGVHRFYSSDPSRGNMDTAQITSAYLVNYIREMNIDPDFFELTTRAGTNEIYEPSRQILETLQVVNNGWGQTIWTMESKNGAIYLKGERNTSFGINKFILACVGRAISLVVIFDPQGRQDEVTQMHAHSLMINSKSEPIKAAQSEIRNGWYNALYVLTKDQVRHIARAKTVGVALQWAYGAPVFLGFDGMPFKEGADKFTGVLNSCAR